MVSGFCKTFVWDATACLAIVSIVKASFIWNVKALFELGHRKVWIYKPAHISLLDYFVYDIFILFPENIVEGCQKTWRSVLY